MHLPYLFITPIPLKRDVLSSVFSTGLDFALGVFHRL
jgi:hypothetical protein